MDHYCYPLVGFDIHGADEIMNTYKHSGKIMTKEATPTPGDQNDKVDIPRPILALLRQGRRETDVGTKLQAPILQQLRQLTDEQLSDELSKIWTEWSKLAGTYQQPYGRDGLLTTGQVIKDVITDARRFINRSRLDDLGDYKMHFHEVQREREWAKESARKTTVWLQRFADLEAKGTTVGPALMRAVLQFFVQDRGRHAGYAGNNFLRNEQALIELAAAFPNGRISVLLAEWTRHKNPHHKVEGDKYDVYDADNLIYYGLLDLFGVKDPFKE